MNKPVKRTATKETDNAYFLKILIYFVISTIWIKHNGYVFLPAGAILGVIIAQKDHFSIDRKVEYAVILISAVIGLTGYGLYLAI